MFQSYIRYAWRHLSSNRIYTGINIAGLAIGITTALLVGLWLNDETSFDHFTPDHERVASIVLVQRITSHVFGRQASPEHPETYAGTTVAPVTGTTLEHGYENVFEKTALVGWNGEHIIGAGV